MYVYFIRKNNIFFAIQCIILQFIFTSSYITYKNRKSGLPLIGEQKPVFHFYTLSKFVSWLFGMGGRDFVESLAPPERRGALLRACSPH